jgi:protein-S-isoprenylcysteine O-methyltransferase Ste14
MRALKIGVDCADLESVSTASLRTLEDVQFEQAIEAVRRARVETRRAEEEVKEFGFRRAVLVVVLCILALVAVGSLAVVVTGIVTGLYPLAAGAVVPLSGCGGLSVLAWRTYARSPAWKAVGSWAQGGESLGAASKLS